MVVEQRSAAVGDRHQLHPAAALGAADRWLFERFGRRAFGQQVTPAQVKPDEHAHPVDRQPAVGAGETIVAQPLKVARKRVLTSGKKPLASHQDGHVLLDPHLVKMLF